MKYTTGRPGRIIVARFEDGDDVLGGIKEAVRAEGIRSAVVYLVGGLKGGRFVVGPETEEMPPVPIWRELNESQEIFAFGTVFLADGEPSVHMHGAYGKRDSVKVGCLRAESETFLVLEAVIMELEGVNAERVKDPATGLALLKL